MLLPELRGSGADSSRQEECEGKVSKVILEDGGSGLETP